MTEETSEVPLDIMHEFTSTSTEQNWAKVVELMPPEDTPDCPECGEELNVVSAATDSNGNLAAARLVCRTDFQNFIYEEATGELFFEGPPERESPPSFD